MPPPPEIISVIVPAFEERRHIADAIASARGEGVEVIVADGGSADGTLEIAKQTADLVVRAQRSRAAQLNAGAAAARGSILLFLHADSRLPRGAVDAVRGVLRDRQVVGGAFSIRIGAARGPLDVVTWGTNLRARLFRLPYGDQGIFVRAREFAALGGFRQLAIMEDVDFVHRLRRRGRIVILDCPVQTSARRWRDHGVVRTTLANTAALTLFKLGVADHRIRKVYDRLLPATRAT